LYYIAKACKIKIFARLEKINKLQKFTKLKKLQNRIFLQNYFFSYIIENLTKLIFVLQNSKDLSHYSWVVRGDFEAVTSTTRLRYFASPAFPQTPSRSRKRSGIALRLITYSTHVNSELNQMPSRITSL